jgi:serpin B
MPTPSATATAAATASPPVDLSAAAAAATASNAFTVDLYGRLRPATGNFMFSGASAAIALAMVEAGARGETRTEMDRALHMTSLPDTGAAFAQLLLHVNAMDGREGMELHVADRIWGQQGFRFEDSYVSGLVRDFQAPLAEVDFAGAPGDAARSINSWVAGETHDRIPTLIDIDHPLSRKTRLVATNAVYFKGKWKTPFDVAATKEETFFAPQQTFKTPMMSKWVEAPYAHVDGVQVIELPYHGGLSMLVALPDRKDGLADVEAHIAKRFQSWRAALKQGSPNDVDLKLPRWRASWESDLSSALQALGMRRAFDIDADFSGICESARLFVAAVVHKTFVEVNEEGSEAAAATAVVMHVMISAKKIRIGPLPVFHADHPFLYAIRDTETDAILFMGRVVDPR